MAAARTRLIQRCCPLFVGAVLGLLMIGAVFAKRAGAENRSAPDDGGPAAAATTGADGGAPEARRTPNPVAAPNPIAAPNPVAAPNPIAAPNPVAAPLPDPRATAHLAMQALSRSAETIKRIGVKAPRDAYSADCVRERLAEARVGLHLGDQESARLEASLARGDRVEEAYALKRLELLVARAATVLNAARACAADDPGGVSATKVEVEISPGIPAGDPTTPPPPPPIEMRPANDGR